MLTDLAVELLADVPTPTPVLTVAAAGQIPGRAPFTRIRDKAATLPTRWRAFGACVENRESHGNPRAINGSGHMGLFQFSQSWRRGLPYVVQRALVTAGLPVDDARTVRRLLARKPINHWPAVYQRIGFARVLVEGGHAAAMRHWHLAGSACNALAAR